MPESWTTRVVFPPLASVKVAVATVLSLSVFVLIPVKRHVYEPLPPLQETDLPAAVELELATTLTAVKSAAEYVKVHCRPAGCAPPARFRFNDTAPPAMAEPDARLRVALWAKDKEEINISQRKFCDRRRKISDAMARSCWVLVQKCTTPAILLRPSGDSPCVRNCRIIALPHTDAEGDGFSRCVQLCWVFSLFPF
jgi:hypothetical protein